jgi:hypothetical protein
VWYDATRRRIYVPGGEGLIFVYRQVDADHYSLLAKSESNRGSCERLIRSELCLCRFERVQEIAPERGRSMNELLNSTVLAWLRKGRPVRPGASKRQPAYDLMSSEERSRLWQSQVPCLRSGLNYR